MVARAFNIRLCALCTINSDTPSEQASLYCMKLIDKGWRKNILFCPWAVGSLAFCLLVWRTLFLSHSRPRPPLLSIYLFIFCFCAFRNTVYLYSIFVYEMVLRWRSGLCKADNCLAIYISKSWGKKIEQCEVGYDEILAVYLRLSTVTAKNVATAEILLLLPRIYSVHSIYVWIIFINNRK